MDTELIKLKEELIALASEKGFDLSPIHHYSAEGKLAEIEFALARKSPPKDYTKNKTEYADPANYKYPIDTEKHIRAAWSYINMPKNQKGYSPAQVAAIKGRIKRAGKKFGIEFND